uniref:Uncharacterized protein n=1 Tax=Oryza brachyantha TaxID=4533 RepID=J3LXL7_ORYBR
MDRSMDGTHSPCSRLRSGWLARSLGERSVTTRGRGRRGGGGRSQVQQRRVTPSGQAPPRLGFINGPFCADQHHGHAVVCKTASPAKHRLAATWPQKNRVGDPVALMPRSHPLSAGHMRKMGGRSKQATRRWRRRQHQELDALEQWMVMTSYLEISFGFWDARLKVAHLSWPPGDVVTGESPGELGRILEEANGTI